MSSQEVTQPNGSTTGSRNPRRRPRKEIEEASSLRQQPQRKRSKLSNSTFDSLPSGSSPVEDGDANGVNGYVVPNGFKETSSNGSVDIPVRERPKSSASKMKRSSRDERTVPLTQDPNFSVRKLPYLPEPLRDGKTGLSKPHEKFKPTC